MKIKIANEEVLCSNNFTINQEMLNTPSVILNNVYPTTWEVDKDYTSRFYHPNDYSQCKIYEEHEAEPGITEKGNPIYADVDTTKLYDYKIFGNSEQTTTTGKNLIPTQASFWEQGTIAQATGQDNPSTTRIRTIDYYPIKNDTDYYYSLDSTDYVFVNLMFYNSSKTYIGNYLTIDNTFAGKRLSKVNIPSSSFQNVAYFRATIRKSDNSTIVASDIEAIKPQIELGNEKTDWEEYSRGYPSPCPEFPQQVKTVTGDNLIRVTGNNLLFMGTYTRTANGLTGTMSGNTITITGTNTKTDTSWSFLSLAATNSSSRFPDFKVGEKYTFSKDTILPSRTAYIQFNYYVSGSTTQKALVTLQSTEYGKTFTVPNDFGRLASLFVGIFYTTRDLDVTFNLQLEYGETLTPFQPYEEMSFPINFGTKNLFDKNNANYVDKLSVSINNHAFISVDYNARMYYMECKPNTTYTYSKSVGSFIRFVSSENVPAVNEPINSFNPLTTGTSATITTGANDRYLGIYPLGQSELNTYTFEEVLDTIQIEIGERANSYTPYGSNEQFELCKIGTYQDYIYKENGKWYKHKEIDKVVYNDVVGLWIAYPASKCVYISNLENKILKPTSSTIAFDGLCNSFEIKTEQDLTVDFAEGVACGTDGTMYFHVDGLTDRPDFNTLMWKDYLSTHNVTLYYTLETPLEEEITDTTLLSQLNAVELNSGKNHIEIDSLIPTEMEWHYNYTNYDEDIIFCGVVKNSGNISLNQRYPHYSTLQILDYKTFLSEGETLDFVIANKTILEALEQVINTISNYGFELGNVNIINPNEIIGAYSTKDKTAYDVFNYIADITQSRWTTRTIGLGQVAIDFYDPSLMPQGKEIDYTNEWFCENKIIDMTHNYGTWDYRNKQVMTSQQVLGNVLQTETTIYDGYATQIMTELPIGTITSILVNGVQVDVGTNNEKKIGITADFYYTTGKNYFEKNMNISVGSPIVINYYPIVEGRQVVENGVEIDRVSETTGTIGKISRYENRNDATTSLELQKIGQSYIKYKGTPEIKLTIKTESNLWNIGDKVYFNSPIEELTTDYMVKTKKINYIVTAEKIFYTFELTSSFNSESEINYFDNQRAKTNGNIEEGEFVSRNVDIDSVANIIFYDATIEEVEANNTLQSELETILGG
jgi:hypothetical protein